MFNNDCVRHVLSTSSTCHANCKRRGKGLESVELQIPTPSNEIKKIDENRQFFVFECA